MAISLNPIDSLGLAARGFARLRAEKAAKDKVVGAVTSKDAVTMTPSGIAVPKDAPGTTAYTGHTAAILANPLGAFAKSVGTGLGFFDPTGSVTTETLKDMSAMLAKYSVEPSKLTGPDRDEWLSEENAKIKNARMWDFLPEKRPMSSLQDRQMKTLRAVARHAPEFFDTAGKSRISNYTSGSIAPRSTYFSEDLIGVCHLVGMESGHAWHRNKVARIENRVSNWGDADHEEVMRLAKIDDALLASRIQIEAAEKTLLEDKAKKKAEQERLQRVAAAENRQADLDAIVTGVLDSERGGDW